MSSKNTKIKREIEGLIENIKYIKLKFFDSINSINISKEDTILIIDMEFLNRYESIDFFSGIIYHNTFLKIFILINTGFNRINYTNIFNNNIEIVDENNIYTILNYINIQIHDYSILNNFCKNIYAKKNILIIIGNNEMYLDDKFKSVDIIKNRKLKISKNRKIKIYILNNIEYISPQLFKEFFHKNIDKFLNTNIKFIIPYKNEIKQFKIFFNNIIPINKFLLEHSFIIIRKV